MTRVELSPALPMIAVSAAVSAAVQVLPISETTVLVDIPPPDAEAVLRAAALADSVLVELPAPGPAVRHGDASRIRWQGAAPCFGRP